MAVSATHEKMQDRYAGRRLTIGSFALLLVLTACGVDESEHPEAPPCEPPAQEVVLRVAQEEHRAVGDINHWWGTVGEAGSWL